MSHFDDTCIAQQRTPGAVVSCDDCELSRQCMGIEPDTAGGINEQWVNCWACGGSGFERDGDDVCLVCDGDGGWYEREEG